MSCFEQIVIMSLIDDGRFFSSSGTRIETMTFFIMPGAIIPYSSCFTRTRLSIIGLMVILCATESSFLSVIVTSLLVPALMAPN